MTIESVYRKKGSPTKSRIVVREFSCDAPIRFAPFVVWIVGIAPFEQHRLVKRNFKIRHQSTTSKGDEANILVKRVTPRDFFVESSRIWSGMATILLRHIAHSDRIANNPGFNFLIHQSESNHASD